MFRRNHFLLKLIKKKLEWINTRVLLSLSQTQLKLVKKCQLIKHLIWLYSNLFMFLHYYLMELLGLWKSLLICKTLFLCTCNKWIHDLGTMCESVCSVQMYHINHSGNLRHISGFGQKLRLGNLMASRKFLLILSVVSL